MESTEKTEQLKLARALVEALEADKHLPKTDHYETREEALEAAFANLS